MKSKEEIRLLQIKLADIKAKIMFADLALGQLWLELLDARMRLAAAMEVEEGEESDQ